MAVMRDWAGPYKQGRVATAHLVLDYSLGILTWMWHWDFSSRQEGVLCLLNVAWKDDHVGEHPFT